MRMIEHACKSLVLLTVSVVFAGCTEGIASSVAEARDPVMGACTSVQLSPMEFATAEEAREVLARPDPWAEQLSAFDRGARMRTLNPTEMEDYLSFAADQAMAWELDEIAHWRGAVDRLDETLRSMNLELPSPLVVKTTGREEFNAAYTRHNSIVLPHERVNLALGERRDFHVLAHEYFHAVSYQSPELRERLYEALGFQKLPSFDYPPELEGRRLSNPQAHHYAHALEVTVAGGTAAHVVPIIQATVPLEEMLLLPTSGPPPIFQVIEIQLVSVDVATGEVLRDEEGDPVTYTFANTNWAERMQRNSSYIIHPEELLADNFALLMEWRSTGERPQGTPSGFRINDVDLILQIEEILTSSAVSVERGPACSEGH